MFQLHRCGLISTSKLSGSMGNFLACLCFHIPDCYSVSFAMKKHSTTSIINYLICRSLTFSCIKIYCRLVGLLVYEMLLNPPNNNQISGYEFSPVEHIKLSTCCFFICQKIGVLFLRYFKRWKQQKHECLLVEISSFC